MLGYLGKIISLKAKSRWIGLWGRVAHWGKNTERVEMKLSEPSKPDPAGAALAVGRFDRGSKDLDFILSGMNHYVRF